MNEIQKRVLKHLVQPGHPQRLEALEDLIGEHWNFFGELSESRTEARLRDYLTINGRGFCKDGRDRLLKAARSNQTRWARITLDVEVEGAAFDTRMATDGVTTEAIQKAISNLDFSRRISGVNHARKIVQSKGIDAHWL